MEVLISGRDLSRYPYIFSSSKYVMFLCVSQGYCRRIKTIWKYITSVSQILPIIFDLLLGFYHLSIII